MDDNEPKTLKSNYPGNSHKIREGATEEPKEDRVKHEKVISGEVVKRKKSLGKKIAETFTGDDVHSVGNYLLFDVVLPAAKNMISDAASQGVERLMFGDNARRSTTRRGGGESLRTNHTSYNRLYQPNREDRDSGPTISRRGRANHDFDEVILATRGEAEIVIDKLSMIAEQYDVATVADLYDIIGASGSFVDSKWGWTDLREAGVTRIRDGFLLNLPPTKSLN